MKMPSFLPVYSSGFLPTYGPNWVNLYGSNREVTVLDEHKSLNLGMGEGIAYRGRLLIAIHSEVCNNTTAAQLTNDKIEVSRISPINEVSFMHTFRLKLHILSSLYCMF